MLAVIGGSGLTQLASLELVERQRRRTPYGEPSAALSFGRISGCPVVFLARHGDDHGIPPHQVNYRANIWALRECGPVGIVAVAAVGSIRANLSPGDLVMPDQIIDYTWGRKSTFHESSEQPVVHIDFTRPYDEVVRQRILAAAVAAGQPVVNGGVYAATQGPRLETAAEINRLERDGADVVGMTGMPEAALARELGIPYAAINVVANFAAGRGNSAAQICFGSIDVVLREAMGRVRDVLEHICEGPAK